MVSSKTKALETLAYSGKVPGLFFRLMVYSGNLPANNRGKEGVWFLELRRGHDQSCLKSDEIISSAKVTLHCSYALPTYKT